MAKKRRSKTLSDQMRQALLRAPKTRYVVWKETGIHESALSRFASGGGGLSLENVDKLADLLGWRLVVAGQPGNNRGKEKEQ